MENAILSIFNGFNFSGIIIAFFSSWITVILSFNRFQKEKWWERKLEAYTKIIESLHNLKAYMDNEKKYALGVEKDSVSKEETERWISRYKTSEEEVLKFKDIGALIISEGAIALLNKYHNDVMFALKEESYYNYTNAVWFAADSCLKQLIQLAKEDLKHKKVY